jgi:uncharacterized protein
MTNALKNKLYPGNHPKSILSLDGGGYRGILTLAYLEKIEALLREKKGNNNLVLADCYDLIGGTSTGAIIASLLSIGKPVADIIALYKELGKVVFGKRRHFYIPRSWKNARALMKSSYHSHVIEKLLKDNLMDAAHKDILISDTRNIRCGIVIISKRADTYSLWTVPNHPDGKYYEANKHLALWELCRASSAAPYYFSAKELKLKTRSKKSFDTAFIDGGVSLANNPAFQLFLVATIPSFGFNWQTGENNIYITSVGTGNGVKVEAVKDILNQRTIHWASKIPDLFMTDALEMNAIIMNLIGRNFGDQDIIDSQYDDLKDMNYMPNRLFSFTRFNQKLTVDDLKNALGVIKTQAQVNSLVEMDHFEHLDTLWEIGRKAAGKVTLERLPACFY